MYSIGDRVVKCDRNGDNGYSKQGDFGTVTELDTYTSTVSVMWDKGEGTSIFEKRVELINRSEEHTSELQSLMRISYAVFCLKKKTSHMFNHRASTAHAAIRATPTPGPTGPL